MITPYVTIASRPELSINKTGFGYMVYDIANAVSKKEKVEVLCSDSLGESFEDDGVHYLKRSLLSFLKYIPKCLSFGIIIKILIRYRLQYKTTLRLFYYWMMTGYISRLINCDSYDIVHIHGCGFSTELWMQVCKRCNQKFVVTLHGLNSFSDRIRLEPAGIQYERDFLRRVVDGKIHITVISTGMKKIIERTYNTPDCKYITVVCNSFSFNEMRKGGL